MSRDHDDQHSSDAMDARDFYDDYVSYQAAVGINDRHRAIVKGLQRFGWRPGQRVFEIGCGIGTLTELLAKRLGADGELVAVDLSPKSIEFAKQRLASFANVGLAAGDVLEMEVDAPFDVIVLPDVIEHIPLERHGTLFARIASWLTPAGFVLMNYPNPHYLAWCHENRPDLLQVIDQPIHADQLLANAYPAGLYLSYLETYSIWIYEGDYVLAVLRPAASAQTFTHVPEPPPSLLARARFKVQSRRK